jgi:hypothetical protein
MLWFLMALIVIVAGLTMLRRKRLYESVEDEPWRRSLADEPLDIEEIRREEEEWLKSSEWDGSSDDEAWR